MAGPRDVSGGKRAAGAANATDTETPQISSHRPRKRSRYTPHACEKCKAAKVRCDGRLPCKYCASRDATCLYSAQAPPNFQVQEARPEDDERKFEAEVSALLRQQNEKLDLLIKKTAAIEAAYEAAENRLSKADTCLAAEKHPLPLFQTSTSAFFCVNVIDAGVRKLGLDFSQGSNTPGVSIGTQTRPALSIIRGEVVNGESSDISRSEIEHVAQSIATASSSSQDASVPVKLIDPLYDVEPNLLQRGVQAFHSLEWVMYPILDISTLEEAIGALSDSTGGLSTRGRGHSIDKEDSAILKMVAAIGLLAEGDTHQTLTSSLLQSLHSQIETMIWSAAVDLKDLVLMTLVILYHLHCARWRLAWRFTMNVSRIILELGLNRKMVLDRSFPDPKNRSQAINTVWTVFVLEQHLSYALGFSNAMQNLHPEPNFPQPVEAPFLQLMIEYASIGKQSCDALLNDKILNPEQLSTFQDDYAYFLYRVNLWATRASETFEVFGQGQDEGEVQSSTSLGPPGLSMVRTILHIRANHLKTLIARAFLCSGLRNAAPADIWVTSVDIAADTVAVLSELDSSGGEYLFHQAQFNHFLISALDVLLFATTHRSSGVGSPSANGQELVVPTEIAQKARQSSTTALARLQTLAETSIQSKYLWERVRGVVSRLNFSDNLLATTAGSGAAAAASNDPETELLLPALGPENLDIIFEHTKAVTDSGVGLNSLPLTTDFGPADGETGLMFPFLSDDPAVWGFQLPSSSSDLDFGLPPHDLGFFGQ
ncbi:hypothetical protein Z517_08335 [Fonsecaea pedrosoi CBS 271.37]|uniref:Zn(2)-C6 fungal-type domain-containing protein n=1 Tax=Fonsecaea pedrosoi CBS 271.37 TaxID=1442368 RepID=A0A0D2GCT7_9EURO|nr:uncharacterized protein Z517_08335 [Fonsecaea pedrosoi CBS 271.37]KIW78498.1 hypothetical protein Z517_08335 [Fonsecaea pedrosoi CBS 271.37]